MFMNRNKKTSVCPCKPKLYYIKVGFKGGGGGGVKILQACFRDAKPCLYHDYLMENFIPTSSVHVYGTRFRDTGCSTIPKVKGF